MKKLLCSIGILFVSVIVFSQADLLKKVNIEINKDNPDYDEARLLIRKALEDSVAKKEAKTWFVAGDIGYKEYSNLVMQSSMGQMVDQERKGEAIIESIRYFLKADSIAMIPTVDKKGKEVVDTKTRGKIAKIFQEYYANQDIVRYGVYSNEHQNYEKAYIAFLNHVSIPDYPMMSEPKIQATMPKDTTYYQYLYYAGLFAIQSGHHDEAIKIFNTLVEKSDADEKMYQFLYQEYNEIKDTTEAVNVLVKANTKFPKDSWFIQNLINYYIQHNKKKEALNFLNKVIEQQPDTALYHYIKGNIVEQMDNQKLAFEEFDKAIKLDPKMAGAYAGKGRIYYNRAVKKMEEANNVTDTEYEMWRKEFDALFKKAIPHFKKAHELDKENTEYIKTLLYLYQRFQMTAEYDNLKSEMAH